MTLHDAVRLVMDSIFLAKGGEVFVTKMPIVRIKDLAEVMIEEMAEKYGFKPVDIKMEEIGPKAGEKLYEELLNEEETRRTFELEKYFVIKPAFKSVYEEIEYSYEGTKSTQVARPYNSSVEPSMGKEELRVYLNKHKLLEGEC